MSTHDTMGMKREKRKNNPWLPLMGLLLVVALGVIAFILGPVAETALLNFVDLPQTDVTTWAVRGGIFLILMMVFGFIYALIAPRPVAKNAVNERDLDKERKMKRQEVEAKKRRQQAINRKMAKEDRTRSKK